MTDPVLLGMLDRTGTLRHRTQTGPEDRAGNPTWETTTTSVDCYVEQLGLQPREVTVGQTTALSSHLGVFPSGTTLDHSDELVVDGVTYRIIGHPWRVWEPGSGESHVEARLLVVT